VLILPPGHAAAVSGRRHLNTREKWILSTVLAAVAAVVIAVVVSIATAEHTTGNGCIDVKFAITIGGEDIYACGTKARNLCLSSSTAGGQSNVESQAFQTQCRKAGLPVG
jgi:hypothetical protein